MSEEVKDVLTEEEMNEGKDFNPDDVVLELDEEEMDEVAGGRSDGKRPFITGSTGNSYVHVGPGLDFKRCGVLRVGETARYRRHTSTDERGVLWYMIAWNGRDAWVSSRYTKKIRL